MIVPILYYFLTLDPNLYFSVTIFEKSATL